MKARLIWGFLLLTSGVLLSSCGKDPEPNAGISFEVTEESVTESDGTENSLLTEAGGVGHEVEIKLILDKPLAENAVIKYSVGGTANKKTVTASGSTDYYDFQIEGATAKDTETLVIDQGATEAFITITVFEDYAFEQEETNDDGDFIETVELTLESVVSGPLQLAAENLTNTLSIREDDTVVALQWPSSASAVADLDLFVFFNGEVVRSSTRDNDPSNPTSQIEILNIPGGYPVGSYSLSFPYYSGTSDNVAFVSAMFTTAGTLNGQSYPFSDESTDPLTRSGTYKLININKYDEVGAPAPVIAQTMMKSNINYTDISNLTVSQTGGSRMNTTGTKISRSNSQPLKLRDDQLQKLRNLMVKP